MDKIPASRHTVTAYDQELNYLTRKIIEMGGLVETQLAGAVEALVNGDVALANTIVERDDKVDALEEEIDQHAIRLLATRQPLAIDLRVTAMALKISNEIERIGDCSVNVAKRCRRLVKEPRQVPTLRAIPRLADIVQRMMKDVLDAYIERDEPKAMAVWHRDDEVDDMYTSLFRELLTYILEDPRNTTACIHVIFVAKNIERIGDHIQNIAERIRYMVHGELINRVPEIER